VPAACKVQIKEWQAAHLATQLVSASRQALAVGNHRPTRGLGCSAGLARGAARNLSRLAHSRRSSRLRGARC
jgi:hypothetical protein